MQLLDLPLATLSMIFFGIVAVFTFIVSIRMPRNYSKDEKIRTDLKKRIYSIDEKDETKEDQVN
jgi:hypothetical protein